MPHHGQTNQDRHQRRAVLHATEGARHHCMKLLCSWKGLKRMTHNCWMRSAVSTSQHQALHTKKAGNPTMNFSQGKFSPVTKWSRHILLPYMFLPLRQISLLTLINPLILFWILKFLASAVIYVLCKQPLPFICLKCAVAPFHCPLAPFFDKKRKEGAQFSSAGSICYSILFLSLQPFPSQGSGGGGQGDCTQLSRK